ncbi:MAG: MFS transporter [Burkholderiales bacterium]
MTNILLLSAAGFIAVGTFRLSDPLLPSIAEDFQTSIGGVAMTVTAFTLGYAAFQLVHGPLGDRLGKLRVIAATLALTSATTVACGFTDSVSTLALLRFATGVTAGAVAPLAMAHIGDTVPYESRLAMIGRFLMAALVGQMVAGSLAGVFAEYVGWRGAFVVFGIAGLIVAACLWPPALRAARHVTRAHAAEGATHIALVREPRARTIWLAGFVEGFLMMGAVPYIGAFLRVEFNLDYATIGLVLACFGVGGLIYSFNVKRILKLLGERRMVITGATLATASYVGITIAPAWQVLVPALTLIGLGFFCMHGILQVRATEIAPHARGTALSGFVFCIFTGQGAGVYILGYLVDGPGYRAAFATTAIGVVFLGVWLYRALFTRMPHFHAGS